jgi:hypothetical protein
MKNLIYEYRQVGTAIFTCSRLEKFVSLSVKLGTSLFLTLNISVTFRKAASTAGQ